MTTQLTIERLGQHGDGVADGPVFVRRCLPGEVVEGEVFGNRMASARIITPSDERVSAPCRHYRTCGGCSVQHATDDLVEAWKLDVVRTALQAHGLEAPFRPVYISPANTRRRAGFSGRRTKKGAMVGFHGPASDTLVEIPDCKLIHPSLAACLPALEALVRAGGSRKAELSLTVTLTEEGPDVSVSGGKPPDAQAMSEFAGLAESHGLCRLTWDGEVIALRASPVVRFDGIGVSVPPGCFLQATADGEQALRKAVVEAVADAGRIVDLFSGCGTFSLPLARNASVHAVEGLSEMTDALAAGWRHADGLKAVTVETRDLFRRPLMPDELNRFEAVVIDPPRAGAEAQVQQIAQSDVAVVAFVSCNPATFARDAAILTAAGYALKWVQIVDQFRWSAHVELVAQFER